MRLLFDLLSVLVLTFFTSCGDGHAKKNGQQEVPDTVAQQPEPVIKDFFFELDGEGLPMKRVFGPAMNPKNSFIVISKVHPEHLNVYEVQGADTVLLASYPVCIARNRGQKQVRGDNKTPESYPGPPFEITQIQPASDWHHDFGDGRGSIPAYGDWFLRLKTPGHSGIGIHGSTNNRESLKVGRGSEGCIRLLDEDINHLKKNYAFVGMKVTILPEDHGPLPFEMAELKRLIIDNGAQLPSAPEQPVVDEDPEPDAQPVTQPDEQPDAEPEDVQQPEQQKTAIPDTTAATKTWPDLVKVKGEHVLLRVGPDPTQYGLYEDGKVYPKNGEILTCLGEEGNYYKVLFRNSTLYINKKTADPQ